MSIHPQKTDTQRDQKEQTLPMQSSELMIEAHNLHRTFGKKEAVAGVSFQVKRGEIFGFLGPNGAGKTTTIRMLTGQIDPTQGHATVAGCDIVKDRRWLKERIGVVFEDQNLYERLSARQNLDFSCQLYNLPKKRVDEVLELVNLKDRAKEKIKTFSNGMRQRIMIARALLHHPPMLFLDEPSRGLDPISAHEVRQSIRQLAQEGMTVLLTTHQMEEADQLCQHIAFIVNGLIVANDTPRNLKMAHGQRTLKVSLLPIDGTTSDQDTVQLEQILKMDDTNDQARLIQWLQQRRISSLHSTEATLEEVFMHVAGVTLQ